MGENRALVRTSIDLALAPNVAFDVIVEELGIALTQAGLSFEAGEQGYIVEGTFRVGQIVSWLPGKLIQFAWHPADWNTEEVTEVEVRIEPLEDGARVLLEQRGWGSLIGDDDELAGWFAGQIARPFLQALTPIGLGQWITDRHARRPAGRQARSTYAYPLYHYPNFRVILQELALSPEDILIEVGCGGGAMLKEALKSGCRAAAIDHSIDMVRLAQQTNATAITEGRLEIKQADAAHLPFEDATFTCATMTGVFGFLPDPVRALRELHRILKSNGRLVMLGSDPRMRNTAAASGPVVANLRFYEEDEFKQMAIAAGFQDVQVIRRDMEQFAREVGVPEEHLSLFKADAGHPFLLARAGEK